MSIQMTGALPSLPWSCQAMPGVTTRSPAFITHFWPSTVVYAPSPWSMKRIAVGECRCAGEVAPAHRHSPTAIRFMLHGEGAYTTVDGQKCVMKAGDLVVTPGMAWHDHGNEGSAPVIWMDILDWQIVRFLENLTYEPYPDEQQTVGRTPGRDIFHPWSETYPALLHRAEQQHDPFDDVLMEYVNPAT